MTQADLADIAVRLAALKLRAQRRRPARVERKRAVPVLYDYQRIPWADKSWDTFALVGGRGAGKTLCGSSGVNEFALANPECRIGVGAPTIGDARFTCAEGPAGIVTLYRDNIRSYNRSLGEITYKNGSYIRLLGSEEPDRWNGPEFELIWADELALWKQASWDMAMFTLRGGGAESESRVLVTTTPKQKKWVKDLVEGPGVILRHASMLDNVNLSAAFKRRILERYEGTRLGDQEILGLWVMEVEGATWKRAWIDDNRMRAVPEGVDIIKLVVAVDPAVTALDSSDETGIAIVGIGSDGHLYIFGIFGYKLTPDAWARRAITFYDERAADRIVGEVNNGGDLVKSNVEHVAADMGLSVNFEEVRATRGKVVRAEPVAAYYEQGRAHHIGRFAEAEEQMTSFPIENERDDLVDAVVWGATSVMGPVRRWRGL